ncbi:PREDICTED: probable inactive shikimate kinase like 1, chloroplastic isoform X2 [Tarenaya hassleriana]|uniref:probable inactive shikimate kinase like 1, chloroplastic isoform X2 n=1 Tax=Tarenaya hassleriana TaxID=28532 RepID=UPI00053C1429|nr:PREDICTED: probable inactive shikimate kinase like 1, chloroplastic isoform X2 [Tarenaya hassleriana]
MEIFAAASVTSPRFLRFPLPSPQSHLPAAVHPPSPSPLFRLCSCRKHIAPSRCLSDQSAFSGTKVADPAPSLVVKRKAIDIAPELKGTSIFLIGINNHIKTNLGKLLAEALRYYYFDSDNLVAEAAGGETTARAYKEADKKGFQESETEVLKQLSSMGRLVVCAGDGAVQSSTNLALIRHGISIWIDVPLDIAARGASSSAEPSPEVFDELRAAYEKSRNGYSTADATISLQSKISHIQR